MIKIIENPISIAEKLINRSFTGQRLGMIIHNHLNSRIHLCWSTGKSKLNFKDCVERLFLQEQEWFCLCKALKSSGVHGLAACIVRRINYEEDHTVEPCIFLEKTMWGRISVWLNHCQKYLNAKYIGFCPVSSSSLVIK